MGTRRNLIVIIHSTVKDTRNNRKIDNLFEKNNKTENVRFNKNFRFFEICFLSFSLLFDINKLPSDFVCSWSGSHMKWGQSFRIRHITTGRYLCLDDDKVLMVVDPEKANTKMSAFCFRISKVQLIFNL